MKWRRTSVSDAFTGQVRSHILPVRIRQQGVLTDVELLDGIACL
jgi:hypothetical protein